LKRDITSKVDFEAARDSLVARCGHVDVLVNNAGASEVVPVMEITAAQFHRAIGINLCSVLFGCQVFREYFAGNGLGRIVNVAPLAGAKWRFGHRCSLCRSNGRRYCVEKGRCSRPGGTRCDSERDCTRSA
jgi:NAD(P)-dependent dehydrogenase (short-subunit alcohol dehydrogenase family)